MIQRLLKQQYGIRIDEEYKMGHYEACQDQENVYLLIPVANIDDAMILELENISNHLTEFGDSVVFRFLKSKKGESIVQLEDNRYCVLVRKSFENRPLKRLGRKLAKFHYRGRAVPFEVKSISRIGMWKNFWEQRLDQMEKVWNEQLFQPPENEFERMFIESFPYYMGLAENAIQYLGDTEQDDEPVAVDSGTVCHVRFTAKTWGESYGLKNPFDWVFDHCSRDLAEWTRERYFRNIKTYEPDVRQFFQEYVSISPLSSFSWRLLYARLMFPLHYFECVEEYYITTSEQQKRIQEERMKKFIQQSQEYEDFLRDFYQLAGAPVRRHKLPEIEWLKR